MSVKSQGIAERFTAKNGNTVSSYRARELCASNFPSSAGRGQIYCRGGRRGLPCTQEEIIGAHNGKRPFMRYPEKRFAPIDSDQERDARCVLFQPGPAGRQYSRKRRR